MINEIHQLNPQNIVQKLLLSKNDSIFREIIVIIFCQKGSPNSRNENPSFFLLHIVLEITEI